MASSYSSDLKLELMVTGEDSNTWGDKTNSNWNLIQQAVAGYEIITLISTNTTLAMTNATISNARNAVLRFEGTLTANSTVYVESGIEKTYILENATTGNYTLALRQTGGSSVVFTGTDKTNKIVYLNGTDAVDLGIVNLTAPQTLTNKTLTTPVLTNATGSLNSPVITQINDANGNEEIKFTANTSAVNEITIANAATGNPPVISSTGTDTNIGLTLTTKGTGKITLNGESKIFGVIENVTISTTFVTAFTYDVLTQAVYFQNVNLGSNFTVNLRGNTSNALNDVLAVGESVTVALITKQAATTYYNTSVLIDGTSTNVTTVWQGGSAPTTGNISSTDVYTYTALKTATSTYTVLAAQVQFK
jgi:hypothetical protein